MFKHLLQHLTEFEIKYQPLEGKSAVKMGFKLRSGSFDCMALVREEARQFLFLVYSAAIVPDNKFNIVSEFITRANFYISMGNFELDFETGELHFKNGFIYDNPAHVTDEMIRRVLSSSLEVMDKFFPGFLAVIFGSGNPSQVLDQLLSRDDPMLN